MILAAAIVLVGCAADHPSYPAAVQYREPPAPAASPIKRDVQEIKTTVDKLKRKLDKRDKLAPLLPPT